MQIKDSIPIYLIKKSSHLAWSVFLNHLDICILKQMTAILLPACQITSLSVHYACMQAIDSLLRGWGCIMSSTMTKNHNGFDISYRSGHNFIISRYIYLIQKHTSSLGNVLSYHISGIEFQICQICENMVQNVWFYEKNQLFSVLIYMKIGALPAGFALVLITTMPCYSHHMHDKCGSCWNLEIF